jgi:Protein kinase domain
MEASKRRVPLFPLIPPLPSSSAFDKENQNYTDEAKEMKDRKKQTNVSKPLNILAVRIAPSSLCSRPVGPPNVPSKRNDEQWIHELKIHALDTDLPQHGRQCRVMRYAETLEALFCLTDRTKSEHRKLCQDIADGSLADDPKAWIRALDIATCTVASSPLSLKPGLVNDLMRLHRRATSRFNTALTSSKGKDHYLHESAILAIWLSYAHAQAVHGRVSDARSTFRYIQNQELGSLNADFYLSNANFEEKYDTIRAIEILKSGVDRKAHPIFDLQQKLYELESRASKGQIEKRNKNVLPPLASTSTSSFPSIRKRKGYNELSPKRLRTNDSGFLEIPIAKKDDNDDASNMSVGTDTLSLSTMDDTKEDILSAVAPIEESAEKKVRNQSTVGTTMSAVALIEESARLDTRNKSTVSIGKCEATISKPPWNEFNAVKTPKVFHHDNSSTKTKRSSLLTNTPHLSRAGLGKAQRINPLGSRNQEAEYDKASENVDIVVHEKFRERKDALKISRIDLNYMLEWDPTKWLMESKQAAGKTSENTDKMRHQASTKNDEISSRVPLPVCAVTMSSSTSGSINTTSRSSAHSNDSSSSVRLSASDADPSRRKDSHQTNNIDGTNSIFPKIVSSVAESNMDFLPLVNENNILRVNSIPYVKLGVLGKGGSCKVYRALSKDCSVLAIKKVKLGGMDRKAIDGYANEIALLNRLRGNPAIIQMYDSEVDLSRNAIFLVMEVGEVDLNFVLQQQAVNAVTKSPGQRPQLNMNFIRLTWHQMLNAVHCIHEERIIHGDLKPANFLFVRGALKLIDFGIAKAIQSDDTTNIYRESQIGTLNYMSPEAILDTGSGMSGARMKCGKPSDIWALGCILYQMVYGQTPFADLHMIPKLQAIVNPNYMIKFPENADEAAVDAIQQCLRRQAEDRPPIVGKHGLLNDHYFLNSRRKS